MEISAEMESKQKPLAKQMSHSVKRENLKTDFLLSGVWPNERFRPWLRQNKSSHNIARKRRSRAKILFTSSKTP